MKERPGIDMPGRSSFCSVAVVVVLMVVTDR
jgi:hypothetical protein